jgi:DNA-binding protein H-NS
LNLKSFTVGQLLTLRDDVDALLQSKRAELETLLQQLGRTQSAGSFGELMRKARANSGKGRTKVPPKYRHPGTGETWSGRGVTVRWLAKELEAGKQREDFLIAKTSKKAK